ncbi:NUDIX domain-containing protein [Demequina sp. NBRC 110056]|uniref:NUDIX domain-containing protein n=1 Tax=Demequina sp. NBRC 110056 TaxID=1570345 RepID=UPI000A079C99|nr:NUDIX domain-containing protein [Demequina sp. NBRC 110056]
MKPHDPASRVPPALRGDRDPGDAWVVAPTGERFWGRFGAAGVLLHDASRGVLLQHRALWSHHGGTWGIPGGALHAGEDPIDGAIREAGEEAGIAREHVTPRSAIVVDREVWRYTTVIAGAHPSSDPRPADAESLELRWVPEGAVEELDLHPAFATAWPELRAMLPVVASVVVDTANVLGSRPDGWWKDRAGSTSRLAQRLVPLTRGIVATELDLPGEHWFPEIELVLEGEGRSATVPKPLRATRAPGSGDDALVTEVARRVADGESATAVTSDALLAQRVREAGGHVRSVGWLLALVDTA